MATRPDNPNEVLAEKVRTRAITQMRVDAAFRKQVEEELVTLRRKIAVEIVEADIGSFESLSVRRAKVNALLKRIEKLIQASYRGIKTQNMKDAYEFSLIESEFALKALGDAISESLGRGVTKSAIKKSVSEMLVLGATIEENWSRRAGGLFERVSDELRTSAVSMETTQQMLDRIQGTASRRFRDGLMYRAAGAASQFIRTEVTALAAESQKAQWDQFPEVVSGIMQVSTFDSRTSSVCLAYGGKVWDRETLEPIGHDLPYNGGVPRHPNCRSREVAVLNEKYGAPARDMGMDEWLKKKPKSFQDELLGSGKAELWRKSSVALSDLLDQSGRPLTLEQLRERS